MNQPKKSLNFETVAIIIALSSVIYLAVNNLANSEQIMWLLGSVGVSSLLVFLANRNFNKVESPNFSVRSFLCTVGGANYGILNKKIPHEVSKYVNIGLTIVFTGLLAMLSGGYAFYQIFHEASTAIGFGILWGLMILNLDTLMVKSINKNKNIFSQILQAIPRIGLALIIAIVISKPLEIRIFQDRILREISNNKLNEGIQDSIRLEVVYNTNNLRNEVNASKDRVNNLENQKSSDPKTSSFRDLIKQKNELESSIKELRKDLNEVERDINNINRSQSVNILNQRKNTIINEISTNKRQLLIVNQEISRERSYYVATIDAQIADEENKLKTKEQNKQIIDSIAFAEKLKLDSINNIAYSNNLITQIEALGSLTAWKLDKVDENGQVAKKAENTMFWTSWAITLLFVLLELAPILTKLLSPKGEYDLFVEELYSDRLSSLEKIKSNKKYELDLEKLKRQTTMDDKRLEHEESLKNKRQNYENERSIKELSPLSEKETIKHILTSWQQRVTDEAKMNGVEGKEFEQLYREFLNGIKKRLRMVR